MPINPEEASTISVGQLAPAAWAMADMLPHEVNAFLKKGSVQGLADLIKAYIGTASSLAFNPTTVPDGGTLPTTSTSEWMLVGKGTFNNVGGASSITTTEELNALTSIGDYWTLAVEIPIDVELAGIVQTIRSGFTTTTPSENAVYDALALKANTDDIPDISGKENTANKQNSLDVDGSGVKFPTVDAVNLAISAIVGDITLQKIVDNGASATKGSVSAMAFMAGTDPGITSYINHDNGLSGSSQSSSDFTINPTSITNKVSSSVGNNESKITLESDNIAIELKNGINKTTLNFDDPTSESIIKVPAPGTSGTYTLATTDEVDLKLNIADYNDRFKGKFISLSALETAYPTAESGDYAQVDEGPAFDVVNYNYDLEDGWIEGGSGSAATNTDMLPEGSTNLYWTSARGLALILTGLASSSGTFTSSSTLIFALGKIKYLIDNISSIYQTILVSGTNIKTFDGISLLGSGDIPLNKQKTIIGNVLLDNTYNGCIVKVKGNAVISVPGGLIEDFNAVFDVWSGFTATFTAISGASIVETALILDSDKMATLYKDGSTNVYKLKGQTT